MSLVFSVLEDENKRLNDYLNLLLNEINKLPKGSISKKIIKGKSYYYLAYRKDKKVKFDYIGKENCKKLEELKIKIKKRKNLEIKLKKVKNEIKVLKKVLNVKQPKFI